MSNRPLFDDKDLPAWLTNAGITGGSGGEEPLPSPGWQAAAEAPAPSSSAGDLSWMDSAWEGAGQSAEPAAEVASSGLPWASGDSESDSTFSAPPPSGDTPWMSDVEPAASASPGGWTPVESGTGASSNVFSSSGGTDAMPWMGDVAPSQPAKESAPTGDNWDLGGFGGQGSQPPPSPQSQTGLTGTLPWRQGVSEPQVQPASGPLGDSGPSDLSWMAEPEPTSQSPAPESAASGLDWMRDLGSLPDQGEPAGISPEPEAAAPAEIGSDWFQDLESETSTPIEAVPTPEPAADTDWMQDLQSHLDTPKEEPPAPPPPVEPPKPSGLIKRLAAQPPPPAAPQTPAEAQSGPASKSLPTIPPPAEAPMQPAAASQPIIKKLPTKPLPAGDTPAQPPPQGTIKKLPTKPLPGAEAPAQPPPSGGIKKLASQKPQPSQPDLSNMTYEEWERSQIEKEEEAQADPGDKLLEEIPDWFASGAPPMPDAPAAEAKAPAGAELMPEWFLGMDEKSGAPAPDWFSNMDLSATSLVGPETVQTSSTQPSVAESPTPAAPSADDVPDWFKGENPVANMDFESMFVKPAEPEPTGPSSKSKLSSLLPSEPEATAPVIPEAEPAKSDLDWMSAMPDFGEAVDADDTLPPGSISAPSPAPAADLDWMNAAPDYVEAKTEVPPPAEAEPAPSVADDLLSDLDWLNEPVTRTPTDALDSSISTPAEQPIGATSAEDAAAMDDILGSLDWMDSAPAQAEPAAPIAEDDVPEWMRELAPSELRPTTPAPSEPSSGKIEEDADWLSGMDYAQPPTETPSVPSAESKPYTEMPPELAEKIANLDLEQKVGSSDIDSLLHLSSAESLAITRADQPPSAVMAPQTDLDLDFESNELDTILGTPEEPTMGELSPDVAAGVEEAPSLTADTTPSSPTEELPRPKRLTRLTSALPEVAALDQPQGERPQEALPEWVENLKPTEGPVILRVGDQQVRMQEESLGKVPEGVRRIREQGKAFRARKGTSAAPESGPLSGIESAIPIAMDAVKPGALVTGATSAVNEQHLRRVKIIEGILEQEDRLLKERKLSEDEREKQVTTKTTTRPRLRIKVDRLLITILLALAVIAPFFTDALNLATVPDMTTLTAAQNSVAQQVDHIQPGQPVLVAFEYGPTGAGELDTLARMIIRDILKHQAHPIIVSTNPAGVMHAQALLASMSADPDDLKIIGRDSAHPLIDRQDYVVLRYLPGGATGVRSLVNAILGSGLQSQVALSTDSAGQAVDTAALKFADLRTGPAFILAESPDDVRNWVEQFRPTGGDKPIGMVFLSSASASATAQAYASGAANIFGPLVGLRDAVSYQQMRGLTDITAKAEAQRWQSVGLAGLLAVVVILFSSAINLIRSLRKRETR